EHQREQNPGGSEDHARLEAAARRILAVKLDIERKQHDQRDEKARHHAQDAVVVHSFCSPSPGLSADGRRRLRVAPSSIITPMPAVKITYTSPSVSMER